MKSTVHRWHGGPGSDNNFSSELETSSHQRRWSTMSYLLHLGHVSNQSYLDKSKKEKVLKIMMRWAKFRIKLDLFGYLYDPNILNYLLINLECSPSWHDLSLVIIITRVRSIYIFNQNLFPSRLYDITDSLMSKILKEV